MKLNLLGFCLILFAAFLFGCEQIATDEMANEEKSGLLTVKITDAPFPSELVAEANVTIDRVELKKSGDGIPNDSSAFISISEETRPFNLLELSNGVTEILAQADIPTGTYSEMRLRIIEASIKLTDSTYYELDVPSGSKSGLKIKIKPSLMLVNEINGEVLIDFDVSRSFKTIGNANNKHGLKGFHFNPVVRVVNLTETGDIAGIVSNETDGAIKDAFVTLFHGNDTITSAFSEEDGYYAMIGLPVGSYSMECIHENYDTLRVDNIQVEAGSITEQNLQMTVTN